MLSFNEDLLHYVWKLQYYNFSDLITTDQEPIQILHPGYHNYNSGPDFNEGKIKLNGIEWNGNIEIHIKSSDWVKHNHGIDPAYDNIILHVVYEEGFQGKYLEIITDYRAQNNGFHVKRWFLIFLILPNHFGWTRSLLTAWNKKVKKSSNSLNLLITIGSTASLFKWANILEQR